MFALPKEAGGDGEGRSRVQPRARPVVSREFYCPPCIFACTAMGGVGGGGSSEKTLGGQCRWLGVFLEITCVISAAVKDQSHSLHAY